MWGRPAGSARDWSSEHNGSGKACRRAQAGELARNRGCMQRPAFAQNGQPIQGETKNTYELTASSADSGSKFVAVVKDGGGKSVESNEAVLTVVTEVPLLFSRSFAIVAAIVIIVVS